MAGKSPISSPMKEYTPKQKSPSLDAPCGGTKANVGTKSAPISSPMDGKKNVNK